MKCLRYLQVMTGDELKQEREKMGLTQQALADALGVDVMTISRWERDVRTIPPYLPLALESIHRNQRKAGTRKAGEALRK